MPHRVKWPSNHHKNLLLESPSSNLRALIDKLLCIYKVNNCPLALSTVYSISLSPQRFYQLAIETTYSCVIFIVMTIVNSYHM